MTTIRPIEEHDVDSCVEFGLEAFRPVFASMEGGYGPRLFGALRPEWEEAQRNEIRRAVTNEDAITLVAEAEGTVVGFVVTTLEELGRLGQIYLIAVDPSSQRRGVGRALTDAAVESMRERGMTHAIIGTGDDAGHGPARATYRSAGFEPAGVQSILFAREL